LDLLYINQKDKRIKKTTAKKEFKKLVILENKKELYSKIKCSANDLK
jgi:hypothetical protein